jgi:hypothetical protein
MIEGNNILELTPKKNWNSICHLTIAITFSR